MLKGLLIVGNERQLNASFKVRKLSAVNLTPIKPSLSIRALLRAVSVQQVGIEFASYAVATSYEWLLID